MCGVLYVCTCAHVSVCSIYVCVGGGGAVGGVSKRQGGGWVSKQAVSQGETPFFPKLPSEKGKSERMRVKTTVNVVRKLLLGVSAWEPKRHKKDQ